MKLSAMASASTFEEVLVRSGQIDYTTKSFLGGWREAPDGTNGDAASGGNRNSGKIMA